MDLTLAAVIIMGAWVVAIVAAGLVMSLRPGGVAVRLAPAGTTTSVPSGRRDEILLGGDAEVLGNVRGRVRAVQLRPESRQLQDVELANGLENRPVPASAIVSADGQVLRLAEWSTLQPFATDWEIRQGLIQQLAADPALETVRRSLNIDVEDQRVRLRGYVRDLAQAERVAELARSVPGVLQVHRELVSDDELARAVSDAIRRDPATSAAEVQVIARGGTVDITGEAPDRSAGRRIEPGGRQVSGVAVVHNLVALRQQAS